MQPHAGSQANMAVYMSVLNAGRHDPGDGPRPRRTPDARHARSTSRASSTRSCTTASGRTTTASTSTRSPQLAKEHKPKMIVAGASAYPREIDHAKFAEIAKEIGALLMVDMAHYSGLVAGGVHNNPVPHRRLRHDDDAQDAPRPALGRRACAKRSSRRTSTRPSSPDCRADR